MSERTLDDIIKTSKQDLKMDERPQNHTLAKNGSLQIADQKHTKLTFELVATYVNYMQLTMYSKKNNTRELEIPNINKQCSV